MNTTSTARIRWPQLWSLLALDVAIIISWIAYHEFQPALLEQFGFTDLSLFLAIATGIVLFITPPMAGYIADRIRKKNGNRLPVINVGISVVSMVFMVVAFTVFVNPGGWIRFLFPVMVSLWLVSMNIFHSPAISTVEMFVPQEKLPGAMAIFVAIGDGVEAIEPVITDIITFFGAPITFAVGGILVFSTGLIFMRTTRNMENPEENLPDESGEKTNLPLVLALGLGFGLAVAILFKVVPLLADAGREWPLGSLSGATFSSILIAVSAVVAYPIGRFLNGKKLVPYCLGGLAAAILLGLAAVFIPGLPGFGAVALFPIAFSLLSVSFLPLAFLNLRQERLILGIGLFFSGVELPSSLLDIASVQGWVG